VEAGQAAAGRAARLQEITALRSQRAAGTSIEPLSLGWFGDVLVLIGNHGIYPCICHMNPRIGEAHATQSESLYE
jgi:hypothetical protein